MPTLTIELSDEEYRNAIALPVDERQRRVSAVFAVAGNGKAQGVSDAPGGVLSPEDIAGIQKSLEEEAAGESLDGDTVMAELRERFGWQKK